MEFSEVIARRFSCRKFDPDVQLGDAALSKIFGDALQSPSSFNLQHCRFVAVRDTARKQALRAVSWNQEHIEKCGAVIAVCAVIDAHKDAESEMIRGFYEDNPALMRDEAIRSAALAAMTLMYAATDQGWDSCPMIGFDPAAVGEILDLPENWLVAMLVVLGKGAEKPPPISRLPLSEVLRLETCSGPPLPEASPSG